MQEVVDKCFEELVDFVKNVCDVVDTFGPIVEILNCSTTFPTVAGRTVPILRDTDRAGIPTGPRQDVTDPGNALGVGLVSLNGNRIQIPYIPVCTYLLGSPGFQALQLGGTTVGASGMTALQLATLVLNVNNNARRFDRGANRRVSDLVFQLMRVVRAGHEGGQVRTDFPDIDLLHSRYSRIVPRLTVGTPGKFKNQKSLFGLDADRANTKLQTLVALTKAQTLFNSKENTIQTVVDLIETLLEVLVDDNTSTDSTENPKGSKGPGQQVFMSKATQWEVATVLKQVHKKLEPKNIYSRVKQASKQISDRQSRLAKLVDVLVQYTTATSFETQHGGSLSNYLS